MSYQPTPKQSLLLWKLITAETPEDREPLMSKCRPSLSPQERKPLVDHGFISLESRPKKRGKHYTLTDRAWAWAAQTMDVEIMKSPSSVGAEALQGLLRRLLPFLKQHELPLASIFSSSAGKERTSDGKAADSGNGIGRAGARLQGGNGLAVEIEAACLALAGGARKARVRLSDLRRRMNSVGRDSLDAALLELQDQGRLVLYRDDNAAALTDDDHRDALIVGDAPRHIVYLEA